MVVICILCRRQEEEQQQQQQNDATSLLYKRISLRPVKKANTRRRLCWCDGDCSPLLSMVFYFALFRSNWKCKATFKRKRLTDFHGAARRRINATGLALLRFLPFFFNVRFFFWMIKLAKYILFVRCRQNLSCSCSVGGSFCFFLIPFCVCERKRVA